MVLKRQTIWLLTMLSLIIVLSVYYISMDRIDNHQTTINMDEEDLNDELDEGELDWMDEGEMTFIELEDAEDVVGGIFNSEMSAEEMFDSIRLQRKDSRGRLNEEFVDVIARTETQPEIQIEALDKIETLQVMSQKEEMIETMLRSKGYEDALVMAEENQVNIYVKANDLTREEVVEINQLTYEHLGIETIRVGFQAGSN